MANRAFLAANRLLYERIARPLIFRGSVQRAHEQILTMLRWLDQQNSLQSVVEKFHNAAFETCAVNVGGVELPSPLMLAAGFVKGTGFESEEAALAAVQRGENIIPGWRSMPRLVGAVEFGSFTRWPRLGNPGNVIWRDVRTRSTQNRGGLKNPGARAAAAFLKLHSDQLPPIFGINIAVSPGVSDPAQEQREVLEALDFFLSESIYPSWLALNISCPNTEDDPGDHQTEDRMRQLCSAVIAHLPQTTPLWVKISPDLASEQYDILMRVFAETGVRAVIATNTLPEPTPDDPHLMAGVGGGKLHDTAVAVAARLMREKSQHGYTVDIIGCGGIQDATTYQDFTQLGIKAGQYWTALVYHGPLAAALIAKPCTGQG
jgi:dihydroorotate dehydrogenase